MARRVNKADVGPFYMLGRFTLPFFDNNGLIRSLMISDVKLLLFFPRFSSFLPVSLRPAKHDNRRKTNIGLWFHVCGMHVNYKTM